MTTNNIDTLRTHLFATLSALQDKDAPMDIERAKAVSDVCQTIINTAKIEVEYAKATGRKGSTFLNDNENYGFDGKQPLPKGYLGVTRHTLSDD
jgi:hypothetical protein